MRQVRHLLLVLTCIALARAAVAQAPVAAPKQHSLSQLLTIAQAGRDYVPPTDDEVQACEELFERTLRDPQEPSLADDWRRNGFELVELTHNERELWAIVEPSASKRGWGFYILFPSAAPGLVLQAPHSYADLHTGDLALRLLEEGRFAAAAWNTVPRKRVDVARERQHPFSAFTQAVIRVHPQSWIVQLHGFAQDKRSTLSGQAADLIVSNGTRIPDPLLDRFVAQLQKNFPYGNVELFPTDVRELGATQNAQGELLRASGSSRFLHLEMSQDLRLRLIMDQGARQVLLKNLGCVD